MVSIPSSFASSQTAIEDRLSLCQEGVLVHLVIGVDFVVDEAWSESTDGPDEKSRSSSAGPQRNLRSTVGRKHGIRKETMALSTTRKPLLQFRGDRSAC